MEITNYLVPAAALLTIIYDTTYIIHCIKHKRFGALFGIVLLMLMVCIGAVIVELPYVS